MVYPWGRHINPGNSGQRRRHFNLRPHVRWARDAVPKRRDEFKLLFHLLLANVIERNFAATATALAGSCRCACAAAIRVFDHERVVVAGEKIDEDLVVLECARVSGIEHLSAIRLAG